MRFLSLLAAAGLLGASAMHFEAGEFWAGIESLAGAVMAGAVLMYEHERKTR